MAVDKTQNTYDVVGDMTVERASGVFDSIDISQINQDDITINLAAVDQSDSAALAVMLEWAKQAQQHRKTISFSHVPDQLMRLIKMTRLDDILNLESAT